MKKSGAWIFAWGAAALLAMACSSSDSGGGTTSCVSNPQSCSATQTCWIVNQTGSYKCLEAPAQKTAGTQCTNLVGQADCGPGLFCFPAANGAPTGTCQPFCNNGACDNGSTCLQILLANAPKAAGPKVCSPPTGTGGTGGTAGAGGSGGSTGGSGGSTGGSGGSTGGTAGSGGASGGAAGSSGGAPADAGAD